MRFGSICWPQKCSYYVRIRQARIRAQENVVSTFKTVLHSCHQSVGLQSLSDLCVHVTFGIFLATTGDRGEDRKKLTHHSDVSAADDDDDDEMRYCAWSRASGCTCGKASTAAHKVS